MYGTIYLTDDRPGHTLTESDEIATQALASAAAVAIDNARLDNARLYEGVRTLARWIDASREITTTLLSGADPVHRPLTLIAERARELADAEQAIVLVPADIERPSAEVGQPGPTAHDRSAASARSAPRPRVAPACTGPRRWRFSETSCTVNLTESFS